MKEVKKNFAALFEHCLRAGNNRIRGLYVDSRFSNSKFVCTERQRHSNKNL